AQHREPVAWLQPVVRTWRHPVQSATQDSGGHAAAGVADLEVELDEPAAVLRRKLDADSAAVGAIDGGVQQRQQDLFEATRVSVDHRRDLGRGVEGEVEAL